MAQGTTAAMVAVNDPWKLPDGWEWVPLGEVCQINPQRPRIVRDDNAPTSFLPMSGVDEVDGVIINCEGRPYQEVARGFTYFEEGDVLFAKITPSMQNGKCAIARGLIDGIGFGSTEFHIIRPGADITADWVHRYMRRLVFRLEAKEHFRGAVGQQRVPEEFIKSSLIPVPLSVEIQCRIVARIEAIAAEVKRARVLLDRMLSVLNHIMEAALAQVFAHIRNGFEVTGIPPDQIRSIGDVAKLERGKFTHRPRNDPQFFGGSIPWIQIQNLPGNYHKYITEYMNTLNDRGLAISKLFPKGTLVLSIAATIGALGILDFDACFPDSLVGITPNPSEIDPGFLYWQLLFLRRHLDTIAPAAAQKNINLQILGQINLWKPSDQEQKRIDNYFDELQSYLDKMKELLDQDAKLLDRTEQSILERAFRGEL